MNYAEESLKLHRQVRGKLEVTTRVPTDSREALSLAYTPGGGGALPGHPAGSRPEL